MQGNMLELRGVTKRFGSLIANDNVSLTVQQGEIVALLGENGAGKSTLMNVLFGIYRRDSGEISINGQKMPENYSPETVIKLGVAMVHQHFMLVDAFTVAENIVLGEERTVSRFFYNREKANEKVRALCAKYGMEIDPDARVASLPVGKRQYVEILKALYRGSKLLILDEPTAVLTPQETEGLFELLREFQKNGMTVIIITHKLWEVMEISDRVVVMRRGACVAEFRTQDTNAEELASTMVGKKLEQAKVVPKTISDGAPGIIQLQNVQTAQNAHNCSLKQLNLTLRPGYVVGIAGVDGNGQDELAGVLAGVCQLTAGRIVLDGRSIEANTPKVMQEIGIRMIPEDRHRQGLVLSNSVRDNIMIAYRKDPRFVTHGIFRKKVVDSFVQTLLDKFDVRPPDADIVVGHMSGGNQQKVILARELSCPNLQIVVACQPTRGLDVGAIQFTHRILLELREQGHAVLLISSDLDEIRALSDEIAVIYNGQIVVQRPADALSNEEIGTFMGGGTVGSVQYED